MYCPHCRAPNADDSRFCGTCGKATSATERVSNPGTAARAAQAGIEPPGMVGREIAGRYRIQQKIGEGGMGAVFKGEQISLKRTVAVKLLRPDVSLSPMLLNRFKTEAEAVAKLSHPNTVNIYDYGQDTDGTLFIAMEFVEGRSLRSIVQAEAPLPLRRTLAIATQIAASLTDAHAHNIIHRDLKPDNVMLQDRGRQRDVVRVLDFGIAKLRDDSRATQQAMTQAGDMLGTPQYMAPEQIRADIVDGRTDVYALGCMMYEMLTARLPFEAPTVMALLSKHLMENPPPPSGRRPDLGIPPHIDHLIMRAMAKEAHVRPQTMELFGEELGAILAALPPDGSAPSAQRSAVVGVPAQPTPNWAPNTPPPQTPPPAAYTPAPHAPMAHAPMAHAPTTPVVHAAGAPPYAMTPPVVAKPPGGNGALWAIVAVLVLAFAGVGIYVATKKKKDDTAEKKDEKDAKDPKDPKDSKDDKPDDDKPDKPDKPDKKDPDEEILEKFAEYKDEICACTDKACATAVHKKFDAWGKKVKGERDIDKLTPKLEKDAAAYAKCYGKLMKGGGDDDTSDDDPPDTADVDPWKKDKKAPPAKPTLPGTVVETGAGVRLNVPPGFVHQKNASGIVAVDQTRGIVIAVGPADHKPVDQLIKEYEVATGLKVQSHSTAVIQGAQRPFALFLGNIKGIAVSHVVVLYTGKGYHAVLVIHIPVALAQDKSVQRLGDEIAEQRVMLP